MDQRGPGIIVRIPPPGWALILFIASWVITRIAELPVLLRSDAAAVLIAVAGISLAVWGATTFRRAGTELNPASEANSKLITHGPFRYTRNAMYSGVLLVLLGIAFFFGTLPFYISVIVFFLIVNSAFIPYEEDKMERQFGAEFREYKSRVHRWGVF
jgi:protein-S-isoprenylcysteine O-methyltransferase Ste14